MCFFLLTNYLNEVTFDKALGLMNRPKRVVMMMMMMMMMMNCLCGMVDR